MTGTHVIMIVLWTSCTYGGLFKRGLSEMVKRLGLKAEVLWFIGKIFQKETNFNLPLLLFDFFGRPLPGYGSVVETAIELTQSVD